MVRSAHARHGERCAMASPKNPETPSSRRSKTPSTKQDFSALQTNVERSLSEVADAIGDITHQVRSQAQRTQQRLAAQAREKELAEQKRSTMKSRYGSAAGSNRSGRGDDRRRNGRARLFRPEPFWARRSFFEAPIALGLLAMMCACRRRDHSARHRPRHLANRFKTYRDIISTRTFCYLEEIAQTDARRHRRRAQKREAHDQARSVQAGGA